MYPDGDGDIHQLRVAAPPLRVEGPHSPRPAVESLAPMSLAAAFLACGEGANPARAAHESHPSVPLAAASPVSVEGVLPPHASVAVPLATESPADVSLSRPAGAPLPFTVVAAVAAVTGACAQRPTTESLEVVSP